MSMFEFDGKVNFHNKAMFDLLENPRGGRGTVGAYMRKIGLEILVGSKAMVGVRTGRLRRSISMRQGLRGRVQYVEVSANTKYAYMHHEGTRKHRINAAQGRLLRFNVGGRVVYVRKVNHPGTKPNPYLTVPMRRAVR